VWNITNGAYWPQTWIAHKNSVNCIKLLSATILVTGSSDKTLRVWNFQNATAPTTPIVSFTQHTGIVRCVWNLPNGNVVSGADDMALYVWVPMTAAVVASHPNAHSASVWCVRVLADGTIISAGASPDNSIRTWTSTLSALNTLTGHTSAINVLQVLSSGLLVSGSSDQYAIVWNLTTGNYTNKFKPLVNSPVTCLQELGDGSISFGGNKSYIYTYKLTGLMTQTSINNLSSFLSNEMPCQAMMLYQNTLVTGSSYKRTLLINAATSSNLVYTGSLNFTNPSVSCLDNLGMIV
jgi:WD40 repeat protein